MEFYVISGLINLILFLGGVYLGIDLNVMKNIDLSYFQNNILSAIRAISDTGLVIMFWIAGIFLIMSIIRYFSNHSFANTGLHKSSNFTSLDKKSSNLTRLDKNSSSKSSDFITLNKLSNMTNLMNIHTSARAASSSLSLSSDTLKLNNSLITSNTVPVSNLVNKNHIYKKDNDNYYDERQGKKK